MWAGVSEGIVESPSACQAAGSERDRSCHSTNASSTAPIMIPASARLNVQKRQDATPMSMKSVTPRGDTVLGNESRVSVASCKRMLGSRSTVRTAFLVRQAEPQEGPYHRQQKKAKSDGPPPALPVDPDSPEGYARRVQERDGQTTGDIPRPDHLRAEPRGCRQDCDASDNPRLHEVP